MCSDCVDDGKKAVWKYAHGEIRLSIGCAVLHRTVHCFDEMRPNKFAENTTTLFKIEISTKIWFACSEFLVPANVDIYSRTRYC